MLTLRLCCDKDEWQTHAVPVNWLSTQLSVSKTKVAPRKYSLFILKLYPIFTVPTANTCSPSNSLVKAVRWDLCHTNILDTECFGDCVSRCVPHLNSDIESGPKASLLELPPILCYIILCKSMAKVSMKSKFSLSQELWRSWSWGWVEVILCSDACCPFPEVCVQLSACSSGD